MNSYEQGSRRTDGWSEDGTEITGHASYTSELIDRDQTDLYLIEAVLLRVNESEREWILDNPILISMMQPFHDAAILDGLERAKLWLDSELDHSLGRPKQP